MQSTEEEWRPVPGYEGFYEVSTFGSVRSLDRLVNSPKSRAFPHRGRILRPTSVNGYRNVSLSRLGVIRLAGVHRLVLLAFRPREDGALMACHVNGNPADNRLENLYWGTSSDNAQDAVRHGTNRNTRKSHCKHGHEFTAANTVEYVAGKRQCRQCFRERAKARRVQERKATQHG